MWSFVIEAEASKPVGSVLEGLAGPGDGLVHPVPSSSKHPTRDGISPSPRRKALVTSPAPASRERRPQEIPL